MPTRPTFAGVAGVLRAARELRRLSQSELCGCLQPCARPTCRSSGAEEDWIDFAVGVQRSLETPLQDAISGPERPGFNSGFARGRARRRRHKLGYSAAPWPAPASDIPPKLSSPCAQATLSSPQECDPAASAAASTRASSSLGGHKSVDSPPPRRRRDPEQQ